MDDAVKRVEAFLNCYESENKDNDVVDWFTQNFGTGESEFLSAKDIRAIIEENKRLREAMEEISRLGDGNGRRS